MNISQWETLVSVINGDEAERLPSGFIIDSPWLPGWVGISTLDYYSSDPLCFEANRKAIETFAPRFVALREVMV